MDRRPRSLTRRQVVGGLVVAGVLVATVGADGSGTTARLRSRPGGPASKGGPVSGGGPVRTPEEFGAVGDGTTDDTRALQAAVDDIRAAGIGTVELRPASVYLASTIDIQHGLTINGRGARIIRPPRHPDWVRTLTTENRTAESADEHARAIVLRDLTVDGNIGAQGPFRNYEQEQSSLVFLNGRTDSAHRQLVRIIDMTVMNSVSDGIHLWTNTQTTITDLRAVDCFRGGLTITGGGNIVRLDGYHGSGEITGAHIDIELDTRSRGVFHGDFEIRDALVDDGPHSHPTDLECGDGGRAVIENSAFRSGFTVMGRGGSVEIRDTELHGKDGPDSVKPRTVHRGDDVTFTRCDFHAHGQRVGSPRDEELAAVRIQHTYSFDPPAPSAPRRVVFDHCTFGPAAGNGSGDEAVVGIWVSGSRAEDGEVVVRDCRFRTGLAEGINLTRGGRMLLEGTTVFDSRVGLHVGSYPPEGLHHDVEVEELRAGPDNERLWVTES